MLIVSFLWKKIQVIIKLSLHNAHLKNYAVKSVTESVDVWKTEPVV